MKTPDFQERPRIEQLKALISANIRAFFEQAPNPFAPNFGYETPPPVVTENDRLLSELLKLVGEDQFVQINDEFLQLRTSYLNENIKRIAESRRKPKKQ